MDGFLTADDLHARPRKRIRLPALAYAVEGSIWHVTIGVADRIQSPFQHIDRAEHVAAAIEGTAAFTGSPVHLYCLMPDHAHLLLEIRERNLVSVVSSIKMTATSAWWKAGGQGKLWQKSFYDHGIRGHADYEATIAYICDNPVKAGLAESWEAYPLLGGIIIREPNRS